MDFSYVKTEDSIGDGDLESIIGSDKALKIAVPPIWTEVRHLNKVGLIWSCLPLVGKYNI